MTPFQRKMITAFGHYAILIDGTHGLNGYDFNLYTLVVLDEFTNGIPVAFCFSNREDTKLFEHYFDCIKNHIGKIVPKIFMSDGAEAFYNAWEMVMGTVEFRLLCIWHVFKNWTENSSGFIKDAENRTLVMNLLHCLVYEVPAENFEFQLNSFLSQLFENSNTASFGAYFLKEWAHKSRQWAMCYRKHCGLTTNMTLEAIHKLLKYTYLGGVQCRRLDKGIQACMRLAFDAKFKRLIKLKRNKATEKLRRIQVSHEKSQKGKFSVTIQESNDTWLVHSESKERKFYEVNQVLSACVENHCALKCKPCNACIHMYLCQCKDSVQRFNICKHIHAVASQFNDDSNVIDDEKENEMHVNEEVQEIFKISDPPLMIEEDLSDQILGKAKKIFKLSQAKLFPIENTKTIDSLLNKVLLNMCSKTWDKPSLKSTSSVKPISTQNTCLTSLKAARPKKLEKQKRFYSTKKAKKKKKPFSSKRFAISEVHAEHVLNSLQHETELCIITQENTEHLYASQKEK